MKNSYLFNKSLPTKNLCRLAYNESLWVHLMKAKYLDGCSMDDWLHLEHNSSKNNSIVWKALVEAFLVGKVGNLKRILGWSGLKQKSCIYLWVSYALTWSSCKRKRIIYVGQLILLLETTPLSWVTKLKWNQMYKEKNNGGGIMS